MYSIFCGDKVVGAVRVNEEAAKNIKRGNLHIFAQNIISIRAEDGDWVEVKYENEVLGYGLFSKGSTIPVKIYCSEDDFPECILKRTERLWKEKKKIYGETFRWVFGEGDMIPGLIIDVYDDIAALKLNVSGLDRILDDIVQVIENKGIENIIERDEKRPEGEKRKRILKGKKYITTIREGSAVFYVDVLHGQKTGFYLDQRDNRIFSERLGEGKVLDIFSYTGGFGIHMGLNAREVVFVDMRRDPLLEKNIDKNGVNGRVVYGDAVEVLKSMAEKFDVISLDPPALVKGKNISKAKKMYFLINRLAIRRLKKGGILLTSSCTQRLTPKDFLGIVKGAAEKEGKRIRLLGSIRGQAADHTYYPPHPETQYLKFVAALVE